MASTDRDALQDQVVTYLFDRLADGQSFVKSRHIATDLNISPKRAGQLLLRIERDDPRVTLTRRGGDSNGTTWQIVRQGESGP